MRVVRAFPQEVHKEWQKDSSYNWSCFYRQVGACSLDSREVTGTNR